MAQGSGPGKDCVDCGWGAAIGSALATIGQNWDNWKIKDWANKNISLKKWGVSEWGDKNLNLKNWGKSISKWFGGGDGPPPNLSSYVNLNNQTGSGQYYGGDGSGSFMDYFSRFVYETDQYNPIALLWDGIKGNITGTDRYNNELTGFEANMKIVSAVPMTKVASVATNGGLRGISMMSSRALTNGQLVESAAIRAERAIGGTGRFAGTAKHTYAKNLLSRYQRIYGDRGFSLGSNYFKGPSGKGFLDVVNHDAMIIYDFKFGNAVMSNAQYLKYSNSFPSYEIQIIRP